MVEDNSGVSFGEDKNKAKKEIKHYRTILNRVLRFYDVNYRRLLFIPFIMLFLAFIVIAIQIGKSGSFINKDVSLKGGVTIVVSHEGKADLLGLEKKLSSRFVGHDISVRAIKKAGKQTGIIVVADIDGTSKKELDSFISSLESFLGFKLDENQYSIEIMGSSLGASFFKETIIALLLAFLLMSVVVFIYFRTFVPSIAVILSAFSDIVVTLAIVDLLGMKLSTGGIAAFLMLIGYSVDTDMLLTTRLIKRKEGTVLDRTIGAFKTGMVMTITTIAAIIVALLFTKSDIVTQIMTIVLIGLCVDIVNTWIQNVGILRIYLERKNKMVE